MSVVYLKRLCEGRGGVKGLFSAWVTVLEHELKTFTYPLLNQELPAGRYRVLTVNGQFEVQPHSFAHTLRSVEGRVTFKVEASLTFTMAFNGTIYEYGKVMSNPSDRRSSEMHLCSVYPKMVEDRLRDVPILRKLRYVETYPTPLPVVKACEHEPLVQGTIRLLHVFQQERYPKDVL
jgi:hypothetical protein